MPADLNELRQQEAVAREEVVRASLMLASCHFAQKAEDPGWDSDMYEEMLEEAVLAHAKAIHERRFAEGKDKGAVIEFPDWVTVSYRKVVLRHCDVVAQECAIDADMCQVNPSNSRVLWKTGNVYDSQPPA
jgi:hypothetical protein